MWFWFWINHKNRGWGGRRPTTKWPIPVFHPKDEVRRVYRFNHRVWSEIAIGWKDAVPSNRMLWPLMPPFGRKDFTSLFIRCAHSIEVHPCCFFKCHRVNKSGVPVKYKSMAPHFRVWSNPERDRRFSPTHNWSTVKKVDCSQVSSCFKSYGPWCLECSTLVPIEGYIGWRVYLVSLFLYFYLWVELGSVDIRAGRQMPFGFSYQKLFHFQ